MKNSLRLALPLVLISAVLSACSSGSSTGADTTKPTVSLASIATVTQAGSATLQATAADDKGVKEVDFYVDDKLVQAVTTTTSGATYQTSYPWAISNNGTHTVKAIAIDTSGNASDPAVQTVTVAIKDVTNPAVSISGVPTAPITAAGTFNVTVSASDDVGVTSLRGVLTLRDSLGITTTLFDETSTTTTSFTLPVAVDATRNGTYTLTVTATDAAGNTGTTTQNVTVNIPVATNPAPTPTPTPNPTPTPTPDTQAPVISVTLPGNPITAAGSYNVTVSATDNVGVTKLWGVLTLPSGVSVNLPFTAPGGTQTIPVTSAYNGTSTLVVYAQDAAGNTSAKTVSLVVAIP